MAGSHQLQEGEIPKPKTKLIWKTFWILLGVTAVEFIIALALPMPQAIKVILYIFADHRQSRLYHW